MKKTHMILIVLLAILGASVAVAAATGNLPSFLKVVVTLPPEQGGPALRLLPLGPEVSVDEALAKLGSDDVNAVQFYLPGKGSVNPCNNATQCAVRVQQLCESVWSTADRVNFGNLCTGSCSSGHGITAASCSYQKGIRERFIDGSIGKTIEAARGKAQVPHIPPGAESSAVACSNWAEKSCKSTGGLEWFSFRQDACVYGCAEGTTTVALQGK